MELVIITGAIIHAKLQSHHQHQQTNTQFFLQAGCPSCRPINSVRALMGICNSTLRWEIGKLGSLLWTSVCSITRVPCNQKSHVFVRLHNNWSLPFSALTLFVGWQKVRAAPRSPRFFIGRPLRDFTWSDLRKIGWLNKTESRRRRSGGGGGGCGAGVVVVVVAVVVVLLVAVAAVAVTVAVVVVAAVAVVVVVVVVVAWRTYALYWMSF